MKKYYAVFSLLALLLLGQFAYGQSITVTAPVPGSNLFGCTTQNITWTFTGLGSSVFNIQYSPDNGANWVTVGSNYNSPGGTFSWTLPNISSPFFLIRVESVSNPGVFDVTDAVFSVNGALLVSSPNGGEGWATGTSQPITWAQNGTSGTYKIEYSTNNGLSWLLIDGNYTTAGNSYPWTVPNTPSNQCLVRVSDVAAPTCKLDVSNNVFSILSSIQVTAPNTALTWQATVGPQNTSVNMDNVTVTANTGNFYDNGGLGGNYSIISSLTKTFYPDVATNKLQFVFTAMSLGSGHTLTVYNGPTTGSGVLATITGSSIPGTLTSSHATGALTFVFTAPSGSPSSGWESYFRSIGTPTQNITWSIVGTSGKFHLDYTTDNGLSWNAIVKSYPSSTGTFAWSVPNTPSTNCLVRVTDQGNSAVVDQSNTTFTIGQATPIVLSPNGGENWWPAINQNITWVPVLFLNTTVKIELTTDNGSTWSTLSASWPNSSGSFPWNVTNTPSTNCRVRVSDAGNASSFDQSNSTFTINPHFRITTPNGGNNLVGCGTQNISFAHGGTSGSVKIELSTDNGTTWSTIVGNFAVTGNSATYTGWQVPNINANQCLIRVSDASDPLKVDVSDASFTIGQTTNVLVLTPNGGENWVAGTTQAITYTIGGGVTMVEIELSTNNGTTWSSSLASGHTGGVLNWTVPNNPGTTNLIRIYDSNNSCNSDVSNSTFTITSTLTVTAPNGGETWPATVGPQGVSYNMDNVTIFTNTAMFYDNGGPSGNLSQTNLTKTVYPDNPLNKLRVRFNSRNMPSTTLTIYNGPSTSSPVLGSISSTSSTLTTFTSTDITGALTFALTGTVGGTGWDGFFESVGTPTQNINWNIVGTSGRFKLDYTTNNGTNWFNILTNYGSTTGVYPWQVPNTPSANCKVRVSDYNLGTIVDESNNVFTIGPVTPVVVLYTPNNNINAFAGTTTTISWRTGFVTCPTVDLEYSTDGGTTWILIAANVPNSTSTGNYVWTIPNTPSSTCRVRVKDSCTPTTNDISDLNFTIRPHLTITSPNGGESLTGCNIQNINFQHGGTSGNVKIELSTDNGTTWSTIINNFAVSGSSASYTNWQVPNINASQCLIRVSDAVDPLKFDVSNATFSISQTSNVLVLTPNGGENWVAGTTQSITYTLGGGVTMVEIELSTNGGVSWVSSIASSHSGGVFNWTVPNLPGTNNLIRIYDSNNFCNSDVSNATFTITSTLTVTAPNGGESWQATVGQQGIAYNMDNVPIFTNTAMFYDNGGPSGNLSLTNLTKTVYPDNPLNKLRVRFNSRNMPSTTLTIYNGPSTSSPVLGSISSTSSTLTTFTSTDITGALTFALSGTVGGTGWDGFFESVGTPTQNINWNIVGTSGRFKLDYTTNNGTSWFNILTNYGSTTGVYPWQVPNTPSANCKVRVSDYNLGTIVDESNNVFTIGPVTPVVVLYTPNNNINAFAGTTTTISWRTGFVTCPTVDLEYSTDGGTTWILIAANVPNSTSTGNYVWTIPNTPSSTCRVRVKDSCTPTTNDISDVNFTIRPHLTITSPNGGEALSGCNIQNINFSHGGTSGNVKIELSTDNGTTWSTIINNFAVSGSSASYTNWQVPNINASQCLIRVSDAVDPLKVDVSNATFTISQTSNVLVLTPNGGENWVTGTTQAITYTLGGGVTMVEIEHSTNNGTTWSTLASGHTGGVYNWTVPNSPGTVNLIRIYDSNNFCNLDVSNATFTITSTLTVTAPNGGESWQATVGQQGIAYNMDNVPIFTNTAMFYDNGGPSGNLSLTNLTKTVYPDNPLNKLRVRFNSRNMPSTTLTIYNGPSTSSPVLGSISSTSSTLTTFTSTDITGALTFALSGTVGGTGWDGFFESVGTPTQNINWNIVGTSGRFKLDYTTNNGTTWFNILTNYGSTTGTYPWQVPNTPSANCKVRVSDAQVGTIVDESNNVFTIGPVTPVVVLYTPNTNINAFAGTTTTISWRTGFVTCPTVDLEYSTDGGTTWITIAANVPNSTSTGNYVWTIPNTPSSTCRVRVKDSCTPTTNDISDVNFTIRPHLTITSPNGGESLTGCNIQNINFSHGGTSGAVKIELSTDNGTTWSTIINNFAVSGSSASYTNWQVPNLNSSQCLVRVSDVADALKFDVSNAVFNISQTSNVLVVSPNGGENWVAGTVQPVSYSIGGGVTMVEIEFSTNNGTTWSTLASGHTGGSYNWTVPNNPGTTNLIRIYDSNNFCNLDVSNATFTITSTLTVTAPNGGENYNATVGPQGVSYNMDNVTIFTNTAMFYDNGGPSGNLSQTNLTKTVYPDNPLNKLRVRFNSRNMPSTTLTIYNGPSTSSPVLGSISSTSSTLTTFTSTDITGALTFALSGTVGGTGWDGFFESVGTPTQNITWNIVGTSGRFKLDYTTNNGTSWINILTNYASTGTFPWQVPNTPSANCKVRVSDYQVGTIVDESNSVFTIGPVTPALVVYTPNGGESTYPSQTMSISWRTGFVSCPTVDIEYSTDAGSSWLPVAVNVPNSTATGTYIWTVPNTPSNTCRIRVKDSCVPTTNDISNANFIIRQPITITSPNGGESLSGCNIAPITFQHGGTSGNVRIDYTTDNGATWLPIVASFAVSGNTATYNSWQLPNTTLPPALVRVRDVLDTLKTDVSNGTFNISQSSHVIVFAPNGNENWITGTTQQIQYVLSGGVTDVSLEYTTNNGTSWLPITSSATGTSFNWVIPNTPSTLCKVRATDNSNFCKVDISDATFTITSTVAVTSPNGGEVFTSYVGPQGNTHNMDNIPITLNTGNFYDNGGPSGNFTAGGFVKTFTPDYPTNKLKVTFVSRSMGSGTLTVYNGPNTGGTVLGTVSGSSSTSVSYISTHATGSLTFAVGGTPGGTGWDAYIESVGTPTQPISWTVTGTSNVFNLDYSTNNGTNWIRLVRNYPSSTGIFPWQIPNTLTSQALVRVMDFNNNAIVDQSNATFTIGAPIPTLVTPNGGQTYYSGQTQQVVWANTTFLNTNVKLEYSTNNGTSWIVIDPNAPNTGTYNWVIPSTLIPLPTCLVRVSDVSSTFLFDVSNAVFAIRPPIRITSPNGPSGASTWQACALSSITWDAGISSSYKIELSTNLGATWSTIVAAYSNASSSVNYPWNVPNTPSTQCLVRVTDNANAFNTDVSDSAFTISPSIVVTYPNYGATIQAGSTVPISWINYNASNFYTIDYSTDGGSTWTNIVTSFNTIGNTYNWVNVPANLSTNCRIRITDATASCKQDISDVPFTIQSAAPAVTITAPNGGEILTGCGTYTIAWNATGTSNLFNIEYSSDAGFTWNTIVTNHNTVTNNYVWTVPNISAQNCLIRVTDATSSTKTDISNQVFQINAASPATISPAGPLTICAGASLTLSSSSATGNVWSTGATSQAITVSAAGSYTVTVTNAGCSSISNTVVVTVNPQPATPTITASGPTTFCAGGSITLTSSSTAGNLWLPGNQTSSQILVTSSGSYSVVVTNANGCSSTSNPVAVTVNPLPTAPTAGSNSPVTTGSAINLTASTVAGATYAWTGPNSFTSTSQNPTISGATAAMSGTYTVMAVANGCSSVASTTLVNVVPGGATVTLSGTIKHPNLVSFIPGVTVALTGPTTSSVVTAANGQYSLTANTGGNYTVTPSKANDVTTNNGVTTLDLVLMQRHILQQDTLDSPYQIIAADVNNSGTVTTLDIVLTRTVILQTNLTFPSGRLWAMVDASYVFPNTYTPFPFPSTRTYASASNASNQDFYGVKLGDVNWSWNPSIAKVSYTGDLGVGFGKTKGRVGELVTIPVRVYDFDKIAGYQYTIEWDGSVLEYVGVEAGAHLPSLGDARASEGILTVSWNDEQGDVVTLADGSVAFNLQFRVVGESGMSADLKATSSVVNGEAYDEDLNHLAIVSRESGFEVVGDGGAMSAGDGIQVMQNFPNPFSKETTVRFELPETKQLRLTVSDLSGRVVVTQSGLYEAGTHEWKWNGKSDNGGDLSSGTYLLRIQAGETAKTIRMVYTRE